MANLFWLSDDQLATIEAAIPKKRRGVKPKEGLIKSSKATNLRVKSVVRSPEMGLIRTFLK
jgi:hypothetical protein